MAPLNSDNISSAAVGKPEATEVASASVDAGLRVVSLIGIMYFVLTVPSFRYEHRTQDFCWNSGRLTVEDFAPEPHRK
jgi:hypothetical protein